MNRNTLLLLLLLGWTALSSSTSVGQDASEFETAPGTMTPDQRSDDHVNQPWQSESIDQQSQEELPEPRESTHVSTWTNASSGLPTIGLGARAEPLTMSPECVVSSPASGTTAATYLPGSSFFGSEMPVAPLGTSLRISNVPYGIWLEVEGKFFKNTSKTGLDDITVRFPSLYSPSWPVSVVIKSGRSPREIRNGTSNQVAEVTLIKNQTVDFDWTREFEPFQPVREDTLRRSSFSSTFVPATNASYTSAKAPAKTSSPDHELTVSTSPAANYHFVLSMKLADKEIKVANGTPGPVPLVLKGPEDWVPALNTVCYLKAKEVFVQSDGCDESKSRFPIGQIELNLSNYTKSGNDISIKLDLEHKKLEAALNDKVNNKEAVRFLKNHFPIDDDATATIETPLILTLKDAIVWFQNDLPHETDTSKKLPPVELKAGDLKLGLKLKELE